MGNREDDTTRDERLFLMRKIVEWWPTGTHGALLRDSVLRIEGPIPGGSADTTTNDLLIPLSGEGKIEEVAVLDVWTTLLQERLASLLAGKYQYFGGSDGPLTQVAAHLVAHLGSAATLVPFERHAKTARNQVVRPFARANYVNWLHGRDVLLWVGAFARLVSDQSAPESPSLAPARRIVAMDDGALARMDVDELTQDPTGLLLFAKTVRGQGRSVASAVSRDE